MDEPNPLKKKGPVGIYISPGSKNIVTDSNKFFGMETGIEDHGVDNSHARNEMHALLPAATAPAPDTEPAKKAWYEKPAGMIFIAVVAGIVVAAAVALAKTLGINA